MKTSTLRDSMYWNINYVLDIPIWDYIFTVIYMEVGVFLLNNMAEPLLMDTKL